MLSDERSLYFHQPLCRSLHNSVEMGIQVFYCEIHPFHADFFFRIRLMIIIINSWQRDRCNYAVKLTCFQTLPMETDYFPGTSLSLRLKTIENKNMFGSLSGNDHLIMFDSNQC